MSKRPFEEDYACPNIVIVPTATLRFPAKKPKLDATPAPLLPPGIEIVELGDIPAPPPPLPSKQMCESDKIHIKTKVLSEKLIQKTVTTSIATVNSEDNITDKASGSEAQKFVLDRSKISPNRSWASNYLMSIGQSCMKPIKINLSTRRTSSSMKESPENNGDNTSITKGGEKNKDVQTKKTELLVKMQLCKDNPQTTNRTESDISNTRKKTETKLVNNNFHNISDTLPTLPSANHIINTNSSHALGPMEQFAPQSLPIFAPLNADNTDYYNYNIRNNLTPTLHGPITGYTSHMHHDIDHYHYYAHNNNVKSTVNYQLPPQFNKSHHYTDRVPNDKSYLDIKIDEFLAKVSRDTPCDNRFDESKTGKDIIHKKSLSLKRHATDTFFNPRRDSYQESQRDELNKKTRYSDESQHILINKPTKDYNTSEKYKDFKLYKRKPVVSSKSYLRDTQEKDIKTKLKDGIIKENYKHGHDYKRHKSIEKEDATKEKYESKKSVGKPKIPAYEFTEEDDYYNSNKQYDLNKPKNDIKKRRSHSKSERDSRSHSSHKSEEHGYNAKTKREEQKPSTSHSSRGSEEHEHKKSKITQEDIEKPTSHSSRRSEDHEYNKSKTKRDKVKTSSKDKKSSKENSYEYLKEMLKQKIKKAKDEMKRRHQVKKTADETKPKKSEIVKPSTSKQANDSNTEINGSDKPVKSLVQLNNNNSKLHNIDKQFDLRSKLSRQNVNQYFNKIRDKSSKTFEKTSEKHENLLITVANDCSDNGLQVDKPEVKPKEESTRKIKNKKVKKIQLVINVVCEESDTSDSEENTAVKENEKCSSFNAEDLSFLDDLNIDEIVNSLTSNQKELDISKISENDITNNIEEYIISDDDSDASTVHLEEVDQTHILDDVNQFDEKAFDEKEHKNIMRDLVNNNVPLPEQRSREQNCTENVEHENQEKGEIILSKKIKQEVFDNPNCTLKETENIPMETKIDEKAMFKRLFTPMIEIKEEPIDILSDDKTSTSDNIDITSLGDHALETAAQDKTNLIVSEINASVTKTSTTNQIKTKPVNTDYVVPHLIIKSELIETEENTASITNRSVNLNVLSENNASAPSTLKKISHLEMKDEPKEIEDNAVTSIDSNLKINIPEENIKLPSSTNNILKHNALSHLKIKAELEETNCNKEVSLERNTKLNAAEKYIETKQSKKDVSLEIENNIKNIPETDASNNDEFTNKKSEHAITDLVRNKGSTNIGALAQTVKESQKVKNKDSDMEVTDIVQATCEISHKNQNENKDATTKSGDIAESVPQCSEDMSESKENHSVQIKQVAATIKEDLVKSQLWEIQEDNDKMNEEKPMFDKQPVSKAKESLLEIPISSTKDELDTVISSKKISPANMKSGLLPTPKPLTLHPTPKPTSSLSIPKNLSPANILKSFLPTPIVSSPANMPKKSSLLLTPKTSSVSLAPKSLSPANAKTLSPAPKTCPANTKALSSNTAPKSVSPANNPDRHRKALTPTEQVFDEVNLKKRMQEYFKTPYDITDLIHRGKFSKIFRCQDETGNAMVVKLMRAKCDRYYMGAKKEQMLVKLQRDVPEENLHFIRVYDGFSVSGPWTFLMEYYPKNLSQALEESERPFHIDIVQQLSRQLATAVTALRNHNIVHSDIKPGHVLLNSTNDRLKVCGFDEATYGDRKVLPNIGTINYRAPEIILGYSTGFSIDVWSTALVMYEMATKRQLFPGAYNNDILFKQICTLGFVPVDMIKFSRFGHKHFDGPRFMRRSGEKGQDITFKSADQIYKNNKLVGTLSGVYHSEWGDEAPRRQKQRDLAKVYQFCQLLQQMLVIHPKHRLPIEFAYASHFLLQI